MSQVGAYIVQFSTPADLDDILEFYSAEGRPSSVYLRRTEMIEQAVTNGLFLTIRQTQPQGDMLIAASATYPIATGAPIRIDLDEDSESRNPVWELGSALRRDDREVATNGALTRGFWDLLVGVPVLRLAMRNGADFPNLVVTANIQESLDRQISRLTQKPHCWRSIERVHPELAAAFAATTDDPARNIAKRFFRFDPAQLPTLGDWLRSQFSRFREAKSAVSIDVSAIEPLIS